MYSGNHLHMLDFDDVVLGWFWWYCSSEFASLVHPLVKPIQCVFSFHSITMELLKNHTYPRKDLKSPKCVMDEGLGDKKQQGLHYVWIVYLRKQLLHWSSDIEKRWVKAVYSLKTDVWSMCLSIDYFYCFWRGLKRGGEGAFHETRLPPTTSSESQSIHARDM